MATYLYLNETITVDPGTPFRHLALRAQPDYDAPIILAKVGQKLTELNKTVPGDDKGIPGAYEGKKAEKPEELTFITIKDRDGHKTYERGVTMMLLRAMTHVFGKQLKGCKVEYRVEDGVFFSVTLTDPALLTDEKIIQVKATMDRYVRDDEKFVKIKMATDDVRELFDHLGMKDKERLFHYRRASSTNLYRLGNYIDYFYGYMPASCGILQYFDVTRMKDGINLILPKASRAQEQGNPNIPMKLFETMYRTNTWGENIGVPTVGALNDLIAHGEGRNIILASEAYQEHLIGEIAQRIKKENRRIVMIAGPSSSGKTTFSHRLSIQLANAGLKAHPIAVDNYFVDRDKTPLDEHGNYDFECLEALNVEQFNDHMARLLNGERVEIPTFNFKIGRQEFNGNSLMMGSGEVLVIEGIHGLNDKMSFAIQPEDKFKIYISALTALNIDEHNRISTTDNREIRRLVRDARTRGNSAKTTIGMWRSVRKGEEQYIFPFQEQADVMFNSASLYELSVLKLFAEPLLFSIPEDAPEYPEAKRLLKFLEYFLALSPEEVPNNSLVREFIGGSIFPVG